MCKLCVCASVLILCVRICVNLSMLVCVYVNVHVCVRILCVRRCVRVYVLCARKYVHTSAHSASAKGASMHYRKY